MQETMAPQGDLLQEFFGGKTEKTLNKKMNERLGSLVAEQGHAFNRRVKIGRNDICPCGSGIKFKKCCIDKINQHENRTAD